MKWRKNNHICNLIDDTISDQVKFGELFDADVYSEYIQKVANESSDSSKNYVSLQKNGSEIHFNNKRYNQFYLKIDERKQNIRLIGFYNPPIFYIENGVLVSSESIFTKEEFNQEMKSDRFFKRSMKKFRRESPLLYGTIYSMLPDTKDTIESKIN